MFLSERGAPFTIAGFARMLERAAVSASLDIKVHPHMLRHACGFALANQGRDTRGLQAYLGHRYIRHTVRYTELSSDRFKGRNGSRSGTGGNLTPQKKDLGLSAPPTVLGMNWGH
jgi:site-specific recombinase XerD